jgi:hypothetical protein
MVTPSPLRFNSSVVRPTTPAPAKENINTRKLQGQLTLNASPSETASLVYLQLSRSPTTVMQLKRYAPPRIKSELLTVLPRAGLACEPVIVDRRQPVPDVGSWRQKIISSRRSSRHGDGWLGRDLTLATSVWRRSAANQVEWRHPCIQESRASASLWHLTPTPLIPTRIPASNQT